MSFVWEQKSDRGGKKRGLSSYPPYLTVLSASVQKHRGTDNKIYELKVKACKSGFKFPRFFFNNANNGGNSLPLPGSLRHWDVHLENLYILIAFTQNTATCSQMKNYPISATPCLIIDAVLCDTVSTTLQLDNTPKTPRYLHKLRPLYKIRGILLLRINTIISKSLCCPSYVRLLFLSFEIGLLQEKTFIFRNGGGSIFILLSCSLCCKSIVIRSAYTPQ